ncbi:hypothetical protein [Salinarimonas soli]|uniref:Uncharacterized protein n=1 Tax=Salinarimonas soli TaxID=1638099 RepID=A0A5B2V8W5_9HYPH|nr:hypothetical protein [Salinarimonas soli]KAA2235256.1 hypothetical protein F0L46_21170 [Salinarimonas soli]
MNLALTDVEIGALMTRVHAEARSPLAGFDYIDGTLFIPAEFEPAVAAILAEPGWATAGLIAAALESYRLPVEARIEATAKAKGYGSGVSCASYAPSTVPAWKAEAETFVAWRDSVWTAVLALLDGWKATGANPSAAPTIKDVLDAIPEIAWP